MPTDIWIAMTKQNFPVDIDLFFRPVAESKLQMTSLMASIVTLYHEISA